MTQTESRQVVVTITTEVKFNLGRSLCLTNHRTRKVEAHTRIHGIHVAVVSSIDVVAIMIKHFILRIRIEQTVHRLNVVTAVVIDVSTDMTINLQANVLTQLNLRHTTYGNQRSH